MVAKGREIIISMKGLFNGSHTMGVVNSVEASNLAFEVRDPETNGLLLRFSVESEESNILKVDCPEVRVGTWRLFLGKMMSLVRFVAADSGISLQEYCDEVEAKV